MSNNSNPVGDWIAARLPIREFWRDHMTGYWAPKNFNFWYFFGSIALFILVMQILTGIWLAMNYTPNAHLAFGSVEHIMRDVNFGWLIRYMHAVGASAFFIVIYLHMFRGLLYGSYKNPREMIWLIGMLIFLLLMAEAFMGYLLPWGQMSFWGAGVITSLFGAIPVIGQPLEVWIRGGFAVTNATLTRFFAWHVVLIPILLLGLVFFHLMALHRVGSNNPDGIEIKKHKDEHGVPKDGIPFHPYYSVKDLFGIGVFLIAFAAVVFFIPGMHGHFLEPDNFQPANPLHTPPEISPLWYFMPFYAILRSIPNKLIGVLSLGAAVLILFIMPALDRNPVKSHRYRGPIYKLALLVFAFTFLVLMYLGGLSPTPAHADIGFRFAELYFSFFILSIVLSRPHGKGFYLGTLVLALALIFVLDWLRVGDIPIHLMARTWWIPALYWAVFTILPAFTNLNVPKPVPERVTS